MANVNVSSAVGVGADQHAVVPVQDDLVDSLVHSKCLASPKRPKHHQGRGTFVAWSSNGFYYFALIFI